LCAQQIINNAHFEIEADPIAYLFGGYSGHAGYQVNHLRFDAGVFAINTPSFFTGNDKFSSRSSGFGLKADYIFKKRKGFFIGVQSDYGRNHIKLKETDETVTTKGISMGVRAGYRFMFGNENSDYKGFYIMPWMALIYSPNAENVTIERQTFKGSAVSIFPTVHLGYSF
jgi:outer membrane autotransporter protein